MKNLRIFLVLLIVSCLLLRPSVMVSNKLARGGYAKRPAAMLPLSPGHFSLPMASPTLLAPCPTGSAPCVQSVTGFNAGAGATKALTLPGSQTAGNMNYVTLRACLSGGCDLDPATTSCAVTDDNGNSYTLIRNLALNSSFLLCTFYAANIAGGANTIHFSVSGGVSGGAYDYLGGEVTEVSGVATASPLDIDGYNYGSGTAVTTSTSGPTTHANDLLLAGAYSRFNTRTVSAPYGYVDNSSQFTAFTVVSGTGTQSISMTASTSDVWEISLAAFKCVTDCSGGGGGGGLTPAQKARGFFILPWLNF